MKRKIWNKLVLSSMICLGILAVCVTSLTGCSGQSISQKVGNGQESSKKGDASIPKMSGGDLTVTLDYGIDKFVNYGRYMQLTAEVTNEGDDFTGKLQVIVPDAEDNCMYQKDVAVAKGENKKISVTFPAFIDEGYIKVKVNNQKGKEICSKSVNVGINYNNSNIYIGVLSDREEELGYLENSTCKTFYLTEDNFTDDYKALDLLDVIVITEKDTGFLTKPQIKALKEWVKQGGSLVVGASTNSKKELQAFSGKILDWAPLKESITVTTRFGLEKGSLGEVKKKLIEEAEEEKIQEVTKFLKKKLSKEVFNNWSYEISSLKSNLFCLEPGSQIYEVLQDSYDQSELAELLSITLSSEEQRKLTEGIKIPSLEKQVTPLEIKGAQTLIHQGKIKLIQKVSFGLGNVIVYGCSLVLPKDGWDVLGSQIRSIVSENISNGRIVNDYMSDYYIYQEGLKVNETDGLPNLMLYGVLLFVYVILIGPVIYLICRKKDRLNLIWSVVPATAVLFSLLIYLIGTSTRIQGPYVNYLSQLQLKDEGQATVDTYFRLTNSSNKDYVTSLNGNCDIVPMKSGDSSYAYANSNSNVNQSKKLDYKFGIEYGSDQTDIYMKNLSAFEGKNFKNQEVINIEDGVITDIVSNNMELEGTVTNHFSFDLEDCFIYNNGTVLRIGKIKKGKSISLNQIKKSDILEQTTYQYDFDELALQLYDANYYYSSDPASNVTGRRRASLMSSYAQNISGSCFFYGFAETGQKLKDTITSKFPYETNGELGIAKNIEVHYTSEDAELLPDISQFIIYSDPSVTDGKNIFDTSRGVIDITYQLPVGYQWKKLLYNQQNNPEFSFNNNGYFVSGIFAGNISVINQQTGKEVTAFVSGKEKALDNLEKYINSDGSLTLYYHMDYSSGNEIQLPNLMAGVNVDLEKSTIYHIE